MTYFTKAENRLIEVDNNKERIVGVINDKKLLKEIVCLLNGEV